MTDQIEEDISDTLHIATNNLAASKRFPAGYRTNYSSEVAALYQEQFSAPAAIDAIELPMPDPRASASLMDVIIGRRSSRDFGEAPLDLDEVGTMAFLACGISRGNDLNAPRRNVPNSGGLGSVELSLIVQNVTGLAPGIYAYDSIRNQLIGKSYGAYRHWLLRHVFYQSEFSSCAAAFCLVVNMRRLKLKYGIRGYRLGLLDAGHVSENINLTATSLGLAVCASAGYVDSELNRALEIDGLRKTVVLAVLVGKVGGRSTRFP
jgi:SagB-type dehydrogenase family enzyme